jgi:hypothetical protein
MKQFQQPIIQHPLAVGTVVDYNGSVCGCNTRVMRGTITKVEQMSSIVVYEIDNIKKIPARRVLALV